MEKENIIQKNKGAAMIIVVFFFMFISLTILIGIITPVVREYSIVKDNFNSKSSYFVAESGVEDVLYRLKNNMSVGTNESLVINNSSTTTIITDVSANEKEISSLGDTNSNQRKVNINVTTGTGVSFSYGVQSGQGGFLMDNNSSVVGSVYSNGTITGSGSITGSAISANSSSLTSDQSNGSGVPSYDVSFDNANATEDFAQSFQISQTEIINKVQLYLKKVGSPSNLNVRIVTNSSGSPSTTTLTSGSLSSSLVSTNYGWVEVPFSSNIQLVSGMTYWIVIDGSYSSTKYYKIGANNNGYSNGVGKIGKYSGAWNNTSPAGLDAFFNLYTGGVNGLISGITIGQGSSGIAHAHTVNNSTVAGNLLCKTGSGNNKACNTSSPDPVQIPMPISEQNISDWKSEAEEGGTYSGNYTANGTTVSLGPRKINGNLIVENGANLTITGTVWVTGSINISNNATVRLHASYGESDAVMISDSTVNVNKFFMDQEQLVVF